MTVDVLRQVFARPRSINWRKAEIQGDAIVFFNMVLLVLSISVVVGGPHHRSDAPAALVIAWFLGLWFLGLFGIIHGLSANVLGDRNGDKRIIAAIATVLAAAALVVTALL